MRWLRVNRDRYDQRTAGRTQAENSRIDSAGAYRHAGRHRCRSVLPGQRGGWIHRRTSAGGQRGMYMREWLAALLRKPPASRSRTAQRARIPAGSVSLRFALKRRGCRFPEMPASGGCGWGASACGALWPRFAGFVRGSRQNSDPLPRVCARCHPPDRSAS
jgi:hypothetical protein